MTSCAKSSLVSQCSQQVRKHYRFKTLQFLRIPKNSFHFSGKRRAMTKKWEEKWKQLKYLTLTDAGDISTSPGPLPQCCVIPSAPAGTPKERQLPLALCPGLQLSVLVSQAIETKELKVQLIDSPAFSSPGVWMPHKLYLMWAWPVWTVQWVSTEWLIFLTTSSSFLVACTGSGAQLSGVDSQFHPFLAS